VRSLRSLSVISYTRVLLNEKLLTGNRKVFRRKTELKTDNYYNTFEKYCKGFAPIFEVWYNYKNDKTFLFSWKYQIKTVACILTAKQAQADIRRGTLDIQTRLTEPQGIIKNFS